MDETQQMTEEATNHTLLEPEAQDDREHIQKIITALRYYRKYAYARVIKSEKYLCNLPKRHQHMLTKYRAHLSMLRDCIDVNQTVINNMLRDKIPCADIPEADEDCNTKNGIERPALSIRHQDMENPEHVDVEPFKILKAQSTLKLIARDWSAEGADERAQSYKLIIDAIEEFFKPEEFDLNEVKILVPGAGLGRLSYDLACRGYSCEGNEFSYFMLIASNFVLNKCTEVNKYTLYPWIHQFGNNLCMADQITPIRFPDVCPAQNPPKGRIVMAAGDFLEVYKDANYYDCVATCFFIDCANNIVDFIETIFNILVPGGIWVNLGPLLYHYSDMEGENSIEPTFENLQLIIEMVGFEFIKKETGKRTKYAQNPRSMLKSEYESLFWICRKPLHAVNNDVNQLNGESDNHICRSNSRSFSNGFIKCGSHRDDMTNDELDAE